VSGRGFKSIAHGLNAHHVLGPRGRAWDSGNVRSILRREAYRGELSYGKTKKRNKLGDARSNDKRRGKLSSILICASSARNSRMKSTPSSRAAANCL